MNRALTDDQAALAAELDRWARDDRHVVAIRVVVKCRKCGARIGVVAEVALPDPEDDRYSFVAPFGAVLGVTVYARDRVERLRAHRRGETPAAERTIEDVEVLDDGRVRARIRSTMHVEPPGSRYPFDEYVVVFIEKPGAAGAIEAHCERDGPRPITSTRLVYALGRARRTDSRATIRV